MQKKLKKQRKKLIIKTSAILIAVWLILSCAYAVIAFNDERIRALNEAQISFSSWQKNMVPYGYNPVLYMDYARINATVTKNEENPLITDVSYSYDHEVNLVVQEPKSNTIYNSDDIINIEFTAETESPEYREQYFGYISYSRFRDSMTDEQYERILYYLDHQPEGLYYYELVCTEFYQNEDYELFPKAVQIVSTRDVHKWYVQDTPVENFELKPKNTDGLTLYHISYLQRNAIPEEFIRNSFGSGGLMEQAQQLAKVKAEEMNEQGLFADEYVGTLEVSPFEYIYYDFNAVPSHIIMASNDTMESVDTGQPATVYYTNSKEYVVYYAKRLNILKNCIVRISAAAGILFAFFFIIGMILTVMMCRSMKMQMLEEQKRRDMTNALAHDIKTPLFILTGYAGNLKENVQTEKREHYADVIVEQTEEVNWRVNRMLELSKLDSPNLKLNKQDFDLAELTREILSNYEALPDGKSIDFTVNASDGKCIITADRELMKRAIENLVDNAVKYSDHNTVIEVIVTGKTFTITNICSAMQPADMKSLMEAYRISEASRTFGHSSGTGLGLSITKTILNLHHMTMNCRVKEGIVTFRIHLL